MNHPSVPLPPAVERYEIHTAVCRYRRQNLVCSTCSSLYEHAVRAYAAQRADGVA